MIRKDNTQKAQKVMIGDRCCVQGGYKGTIEEVIRLMASGKPCTYIRVSFDEDTGLKNTAFDHGVYGCCDIAWDYT